MQPKATRRVALVDPSKVRIRPIQATDNQQTAVLIRRVMSEFGCVGAGYSYEDPEVDQMFEFYSGEYSAFFVVEVGKRILGCGGVGPLAGNARDICELRKMYFDSRLRGHGFGRRLLQLCLDTALKLGFRTCYLETVARMTTANMLYGNFGFEKLNAPLGNTGHSGCDAWYSLDLCREPHSN